MTKKNTKFYITTAVDYANAPLHLGHILEKVQADILARYHRILGEEVFFLTGSDENAQKNVLAARKKGVPVDKLVDENIALFKKATELFNISNDDFIRTSDKQRHWPGVEKLWQACVENEDIYKKKYKGFYCVGCEAFLTEKDLENGLCPEHLKKPEEISEENYFFKLSKYQKELEKLIGNDKIKIVPQKRKNEVLSFIKSGLQDISVSRPAERMDNWGVPVPGDEKQIIYVWFDALSNYLTALGYGGDEKKFTQYWPADIHVIGKGIIRFHAVYWPAMLLSAGIELPKTIFVHGYLTVNGQKISKSLGNTIDPIELEKKYGADAIRYFLLREIPSIEDGDFSIEKFETRYNDDLAKGLGNLVARVLKLSENIEPKLNNKELEKEITRVKIESLQTLDDFKFNVALKIIWELIAFCDKYIEKEKPWEGGKDEVIANLLFAISEISQLLKPFLPETSEEIFEQIRSRKAETLFPRLN